MADKPKRHRSTKNTVIARNTLKLFLELQESVNEDILDAYQVLRDTMRDKNATPATKRQCANDIIALYDKMHKDSVEALEDDKPEVEEDDSNKSSVVDFKFRG